MKTKIKPLIEAWLQSGVLTNRLQEEGLIINESEALLAADFVDNASDFKILEWIN